MSSVEDLSALPNAMRIPEDSTPSTFKLALRLSAINERALRWGRMPPFSLAPKAKGTSPRRGAAADADNTMDCTAVVSVSKRSQSVSRDEFTMETHHHAGPPLACLRSRLHVSQSAGPCPSRRVHRYSTSPLNRTLKRANAIAYRTQVRSLGRGICAASRALTPVSSHQHCKRPSQRPSPASMNPRNQKSQHEVDSNQSLPVYTSVIGSTYEVQRYQGPQVHTWRPVSCRFLFSPSLPGDLVLLIRRVLYPLLGCKGNAEIDICKCTYQPAVLSHAIFIITTNSRWMYNIDAAVARRRTNDQGDDDNDNERQMQRQRQRQPSPPPPPPLQPSAMTWPRAEHVRHQQPNQQPASDTLPRLPSGLLRPSYVQHTTPSGRSGGWNASPPSVYLFHRSEAMDMGSWPGRTNTLVPFVAAAHLAPFYYYVSASQRMFRFSRGGQLGTVRYGTPFQELGCRPRQVPTPSPKLQTGWRRRGFGPPGGVSSRRMRSLCKRSGQDPPFPRSQIPDAATHIHIQGHIQGHIALHGIWMSALCRQGCGRGTRRASEIHNISASHTNPAQHLLNPVATALQHRSAFKRSSGLGDSADTVGGESTRRRTASPDSPRANPPTDVRWKLSKNLANAIRH
ncbi:hypothetical protein G7046_g7970 [Stylonectria norvegica]|nr:hypothetical protein G7046_g7970 [Stylonectria norvegica]